MASEDRVTPPVLSVATKTNGTIIIASSIASAKLVFPDEWTSNFVNIFADGADVYVTFGIDADAAVIAAATTVAASGVITTHAAGECLKIPDGQSREMDLSLLGEVTKDAPWVMHHIESSAGGFVRITRSSGTATRRT